MRNKEENEPCKLKAVLSISEKQSFRLLKKPFLFLKKTFDFRQQAPRFQTIGLSLPDNAPFTFWQQSCHSLATSLSLQGIALSFSEPQSVYMVMLHCAYHRLSSAHYRLYPTCYRLGGWSFCRAGVRAKRATLLGLGGEGTRPKVLVLLHLSHGSLREKFV